MELVPFHLKQTMTQEISKDCMICAVSQDLGTLTKNSTGGRITEKLCDITYFLKIGNVSELMAGETSLKSSQT